MARHLTSQETGVVSLPEFIAWVEKNVDLSDLDSLATAGPMLRKLANDPRLVVRTLNERVMSQGGRAAIYSSQVLHLGSGKDFYVRANFWPSNAELAGRRVLSDQFAYDSAHDHNYSFVTTAYDGPGYFTELYEADLDRLPDQPGESVDLRFIERHHFRKGQTMLYEAHRDVHLQFAPEEFSVSLNLVAVTPDVRIKEQRFYDLQRMVLVEYPGDTDVSKRVSIVRMLGALGDENSVQVLYDLMHSSPCRRTKLAAIESLLQLQPGNRAEVLDLAGRLQLTAPGNAAQTG
jgi:hypothetical protein